MHILLCTLAMCLLLWLGWHLLQIVWLLFEGDDYLRVGSDWRKYGALRKVILEPYQNPVRVHDSVQSVGNGQDSTLRELVTYGLLNYSISPVREESQPRIIWYVGFRQHFIKV